MKVCAGGVPHGGDEPNRGMRRAARIPIPHPPWAGWPTAGWKAQAGAGIPFPRLRQSVSRNHVKVRDEPLKTVSGFAEERRCPGRA